MKVKQIQIVYEKQEKYSNYFFRNIIDEMLIVEYATKRKTGDILLVWLTPKIRNESRMMIGELAGNRKT